MNQFFETMSYELGGQKMSRAHDKIIDTFQSYKGNLTDEELYTIAETVCSELPEELRLELSGKLEAE
jgi:hypothetical protein